MASALRIIPCLDVKDGRVVKGVNFVDLKDAGDPVQLAEAYNQAGADEITFLDISASVEGRATMREVVKQTAAHVFVPLTVGGGVRSCQDVSELLKCGADKVGINTAAINTPALLTQIASDFGAQVICLSVDARRAADQPSGYEVTTHGGTRSAGLDALAWVQEAIDLGAGEILLNSMDADGTRDGFDLEMLRAVRQVCSVPLIASGGAGTAAHFVAAAREGVDAILAASVFHYGTLSISEVKAELCDAGFEVRQ